MKSIRQFYSLFLISFVVMIMSTSCVNAKWVRGNGNVTTQNREIGSFKRIATGNGLDVYLIQGDKEGVTVEADENLMDIIITEVRGNELIVKTKENIRMASSRKVYVTFIKLEELDASSGSDVVSKEKLNLDFLDIEVSSGADVKLMVNAREMYCSVSSGADAVLSGKVETFFARASSGSDLRARDLKARFCEAKASSGGDVSVYAVERLKASASSGGDVNYYGNPKEVDRSESSGGDVSRR
ncbi:MAG: head GIN domain-containing protein [Marinifilaceae bacterium]